MSQNDLRLQLLGFALAGADIVFDVDPSGVVGLCLGATGDCAGRPWTSLFAPADTALLQTLRLQLPPGSRHGPVRVRLVNQHQDWIYKLSLFALPQRPGWTSCALSAGAPSAVDAVQRRSDGLMQAEAFTQAIDGILDDPDLAVDDVFIDLIDATAHEGGSPPSSATPDPAVQKRVAALLRAKAYSGSAVAEVAPRRFAMVRTRDADVAALCEELKTAAGWEDVRHSSVHLAETSRADRLLLVRHVLNRFPSSGVAVTDNLVKAVETTRRDAETFRRRVFSGDFKLHYQPVVRLSDHELHHFEALARFEGDLSPADMIEMAEGLDIISDFDLAVAERAAELLRGSSASVAINVSARSLEKPGFRSRLIGLTQAKKALRSRLLIEITETHALTDLSLASHALTELREAGHAICLDDFGAGASSLDYLRRLPLDYVKIDGRYVRNLKRESRDHALIKAVVGLCHDLNLPVIAECVETKATLDILKDLKIDFGQGWLFGRPSPVTSWSPAKFRALLSK